MTSPPSEELKACPFCGGEPYVIEDDRYNRCHVGCDCVAGPRIWQDVGFLSDAIAAWNRRHTSSRREVEMSDAAEMLRNAKESIKDEVADEADWTFDSQGSGMQIDAVCHRAAVAATAPYLQEIARLRAAISAAQGYMINAVIDMQTGTKKTTTIATLEGGIKRTREALL